MEIRVKISPVRCPAGNRRDHFETTYRSGRLQTPLETRLVVVVTTILQILGKFYFIAHLLSLHLVLSRNVLCS